MNKESLIFKPSFLNYLKRVKEISQEYTKSLFWKRLLTDLQKTSRYNSIEEVDPVALEAIIKEEMNNLTLMGYCFEELNYKTLNITQDLDHLKALNYGKLLLRIRNNFNFPLVNKLASNSQWEHMYSLQILKRFKLLSCYASKLPMVTREGTGNGERGINKGFTVAVACSLFPADVHLKCTSAYR